MAWNRPLEFYERFTVTTCRNPDYCHHCNTLIKEGQIKVAWKANIFHKRCIEQRTRGAVRVNTGTMRVEKNDNENQ